MLLFEASAAALLGYLSRGVVRGWWLRARWLVKGAWFLSRRQPNNGMQRTRKQAAFHQSRFVRAADAGRYASTL